MTPDELADRHPRLYHLTVPEAAPGILRHGLLPPTALLDLFEADAGTRARALARRAERLVLSHPRHGVASLTDNRPLSDAWLARILDGGLTPDAWRLMLAERTFFWTSEADLGDLSGAVLNRGLARVVLVLDTRSLARAHAPRVEISPINSGATQHRPPRRGPATFAPILSVDWPDWRRRRGRTSPDRIREVTVRGGVPDLAAHLLEARELRPRGVAARSSQARPAAQA